MTRRLSEVCVVKVLSCLGSGSAKDLQLYWISHITGSRFQVIDYWWIHPGSSSIFNPQKPLKHDMKSLAQIIIKFYQQFISPNKRFVCADHFQIGKVSWARLGYYTIRFFGIWQGIRVLRQRWMKWNNSSLLFGSFQKISSTGWLLRFTLRSSLWHTIIRITHDCHASDHGHLISNGPSTDCDN